MSKNHTERSNSSNAALMNSPHDQIACTKRERQVEEQRPSGSFRLHTQAAKHPENGVGYLNVFRLSNYSCPQGQKETESGMQARKQLTEWTHARRPIFFPVSDDKKSAAGDRPTCVAHRQQQHHNPGSLHIAPPHPPRAKSKRSSATCKRGRKEKLTRPAVNRLFGVSHQALFCPQRGGALRPTDMRAAHVAARVDLKARGARKLVAWSGRGGTHCRGKRKRKGTPSFLPVVIVHRALEAKPEN